MTKAQRDIRRKLRILAYAKEIGNISKACRYFGISRQEFYKWKKAYAAYGKKGLIPFGQTMVMSFKPSFIGMWRIWESDARRV